MNSIAAKRAKDKRITNDILKIGVEARKACETNNEAVNATVGMLYEDDTSFTYFDSVLKISNNLKPIQYLPYTSTPGGDDFTEAIAKWSFRQHYNFYKDNIFYAVSATPGGSGAISSTIANYLDENDDFLVPKVYWDPYLIMAREQNVNLKTYNLFDSDGNFDLDDFEKCVDNAAISQEKILILINDPCQNPTGYTLKQSEWERVIKILNVHAEKGIPTTLLYDMAYIDYHKDGLDASRMPFDVFKSAHQDLLIICAFSGSKTLSFYGIRIGAMLAISKNEEIISEFKRIISFSSRGRWSSTSHLGIRTIVELVNDEVAKKEFEYELERAVKLLSKRGEIFVKEASECGLETLPYKSGFFITLPNCSHEVFEALMENHIYTIPLPGNLVRFAVSSIPTELVYGLAAKVKRIKDEVNK
ncbi:MAG: pyridoxal phosphate-dependent aminotransferase [Bacilli bacterium]